MLPSDGHTHTEWSWDTLAGSMDKSCARAVELGLPSIAFTEHADHTSWVRPSGEVLEPPSLDVAGYLASVARCREVFPGLHILSGVELGEPHWHADRVGVLLAAARFDRVLGSVHSIRASGVSAVMVDDLFATRPADEVVRLYLAEALRLAESTGPFAVLAHIDYPVRSWPAGGLRPAAFDPAAFEEEFRAVLRALASSGRALEVNTKVPLHADVVRWWYEVGGDAVSFGSDAHEPAAVARGFADAAAMVEACGFRSGSDPHAFWTRHGDAPTPMRLSPMR